MKLIQTNRRYIKAFSVIIIITAGIMYNGNYGVRIFGVRIAGGEQENALNIASDEPASSIEKIAGITKTALISGIKQLTSNH